MGEQKGENKSEGEWGRKEGERERISTEKERGGK